MDIIAIALLTIVASTVGTISGFGTSTIMIPLLAMFLPPVETIFLVAIIHWFGNVWKLTLFRSGFTMRLFVLFGLTGLVTSYLGAYVSLGVSETVLLRFLGAFLFGYSLFLLFQSSFRIPAGSVTAIAGGAASGFFAGMLGMGGAIRSAALFAFDLPKGAYIATAGAIGLLVDSSRIITYIAGDATLPPRLWYGLFLFIPLSFLGAQAAKKIVDYIPQKRFRTVVAFFLLAIGAKLIFLP